MNIQHLLLSLLFLAPGLTAAQALEINTIPHPQTLREQAGGELKFPSLKIKCDSKKLKKETSFLKKELEKLTNGIPASAGKASVITLSLDKADAKKTEGYTLSITPHGITLKGTDPAGVFYGIQTLLQEIKKTPDGDALSLECGLIEDSPRYGWRGFMLDEARHFFGKDKVKQLIDNMARFKMNKLHWHLTDEPGWRIEIKKYPKLTTVGAQGNWSTDKTAEPQFYTQDDIREIVAYAADRHIEIIPEIDMPGHATAACRAYPELSGGGTKEHPDFTFNPGKEEVYAFLTDVLKEVSALFPSQYIHIGGDEVAFAIVSWDKDPAVQALVKKEGMKNYKEAESYFFHRINKVVKDLNKTVLGWDELLNHKPTPETNILWWRHDRVEALKKSLASGHPTIMCPRRPLYFDFTQHKDHKWGRTWNGFCPMEDVYEFPDKGLASWNLTPEEQDRIKGIQACLWTERIHNTDRLDFMTYPRICALAESAWTRPDRKDYQDFMRRMEPVFTLFDKQGLYYFDPRTPDKRTEPKGCEKASGTKLPLDFRD